MRGKIVASDIHSVFVEAAEANTPTATHSATSSANTAAVADVTVAAGRRGGGRYCTVAEGKRMVVSSRMRRTLAGDTVRVLDSLLGAISCCL